MGHLIHTEKDPTLVKDWRAPVAGLACVLAFVVILLGAYTRLTNAGLSCPDWPNCYGYLTAPHTPQQVAEATSRYPHTPVETNKAWTEMTHRYLAGTEGLLIVVLASSILARRKRYTPAMRSLSIALIVWFIVQALLGMFTVTARLSPVVVLSHLLMGLTLLSLLWWITLSLYEKVFSAQTPTMRLMRWIKQLAVRRTHYHAVIPWLYLGLIIILTQITLGGWVSTHSAGLACVDFPYCNGHLMPPLTWNLQHDLITMHMVHRLGALVTLLYFILLGYWLLRMPVLRNMGIILLILVALQVTLGILNVIWLRPIIIALCHLAIAILLLLTILTGLRWLI
jgi:cytochrome c oxidase assembly protein subunit 15